MKNDFENSIPKLANKMADESMHLGVLDYIIVVLVLAISACIGIYYRCTGGKQKTVKVSLR